jgi:co-chaperonin GroES (HSP10)
MSKNYIEPATDHVLVIDAPHDTTIDGISLPDNVKQQEMVFGTVVCAGPNAHKTKPRDNVGYGPYAGKNVVMEGLEYRLIREGQIEFYIRKSN